MSHHYLLYNYEKRNGLSEVTVLYFFWIIGRVGQLHYQVRYRVGITKIHIPAPCIIHFLLNILLQLLFELKYLFTRNRSNYI